MDGELKYVHQTTYGMSERLVGSIVAFHGDDKGLVLPPDIAPFQIVIVPILAKGKVEEVIAEARKLSDELLAAGIRVTLDDRDDRPGSKFYHWEIKGVPLRLEMGMRDIEGGKVATPSAGWAQGHLGPQRSPSRSGTRSPSCGRRWTWREGAPPHTGPGLH